MRVAVLDFTTSQQSTRFRQFIDDCRIGIAFFTFGVQNIRSAEEGQVRAHGPVFHHVVSNDLFKHPKITVKFKLLHPVRGGAMNKSCALCVGHERCGAKIADIVPFPV